MRSARRAGVLHDGGIDQRLLAGGTAGAAAVAPWSLPLMIMVLTFIVETLVVRHYGLAVIFITPMTLLLADASLLGHGSTGSLLQARLLDTVAGSFAGLLGGVVLHAAAARRGRPGAATSDAATAAILRRAGAALARAAALAAQSGS